MRRSGLKIMGAVAAAAVLVGVSGTPAAASSDSGHSYGYGVCGTVSDGWFKAYGEVFYLDDTCGDGRPAALKVDIEPLQSGGGYDYILWNSKGYDGGVASWNKSYAEGTDVCIQAGSAQYVGGSLSGLGSWECGAA